MRPLAGGDAIIFDYLVQVCAIVKRRGIGDRNDVIRIMDDHLRHGPRQRQAAADREKERLEADNARLRRKLREAQQANVAVVTLDGADQAPPRRIVELTRAQYETLIEYSEGKKHQAIATELGLSLASVRTYVSRAAEELGADSPAQAAALINRGVLAIRAKGNAA